MNSIKLLAAIAALGLVATPAMSQSTNTMGNSMGGMSGGSMDKRMMDKGMMNKGMGSKSHMMPINPYEHVQKNHRDVPQEVALANDEESHVQQNDEARHVGMV